MFRWLPWALFYGVSRLSAVGKLLPVIILGFPRESRNWYLRDMGVYRRRIEDGQVFAYLWLIYGWRMFQWLFVRGEMRGKLINGYLLRNLPSLLNFIEFSNYFSRLLIFKKWEKYFTNKDDGSERVHKLYLVHHIHKKSSTLVQWIVQIFPQQFFDSIYSSGNVITRN